MNSNTQKLVAYAALAVVCAVIVGVWGVFAFYGKTPVDGFIAQLAGLLTIVVGAIAALGATHVATAAANKSAFVTGTLSAFAEPLVPPAAPAPAEKPEAVTAQQ
jgi:ABC-type xylose transport system permease subunit